MERQDPLLSILIVNWNTREALANCLRHLPESAGGLPFQTIIVDNNSTDGSQEMLTEEFPWVVCIPAGRNLGYGAGMNLAIRRVKSPYLLLLNPDVVPQKSAIKTLVTYLRDNRRIAVVGGSLFGKNGRSQMEDYYVPFPTLLSAILDYTRWSAVLGAFHLSPDRFADRSVRQVPGACFLTRRTVLEAVGPFDEGFFVWFEDVDWCYRAHRNHFGLGVCEDAVFFHEGGKSFEAVSRETQKKWFYWSMLRFFRKHKALSSWVVLASYIFVEETLVMTIAGVIGLLWGPSRKTMLCRSRRAADFVRYLRRKARWE